MRNARQFTPTVISGLSRTLATAVVVALSVGFLAPAHAAVEVDLSVLNDGGASTVTGRTGLKMPGTAFPKSEYIGPPVKVTVPAPAPAPKPEPAVEEAAVPEPASVPEQPAPEVAAAPEPEPTSEMQSEPVAAAEPAPSGDSPPPPPPEPAALDITPTPSADSSTDTATSSASAMTETVGETEKPTETASTGDQATGASRVVFAGEDTRLPDGAEAVLDPIAAHASADDNLRIQLRAYAGGSEISASKARRLSLSRALAVRSYLIEQGVRSTRIDVRALGDKVDDDPVNRVDIDVGAR